MNKRSIWLAGSSALTIATLMSFVSAGDALAAGPADTVVEEGTLELKGGSISHEDANVVVGTTNGKTGKLLISDGGDIVSRRGLIGDVSGSSGEVVVTGKDSLWQNSERVLVGNDGAGTLTIENGGKVVSGAFSAVGWGDGSTGTATITGTGSEWKFLEQLDIGSSGKGELTVSDGGKLTGDIVYVGAYGSGEGTLTITGKGSVAALTDDMMVGNDEGQGKLTVSDGALLTSARLVLGNLEDSTGNVTVTGSGSKIITGNVFVGRDGQGTLNINAGGSLSGKALNIGMYEGSNGAVEVIGKDSSINLSSYLRVGNDGQGQLTISDGATVKSSRGEIGVWNEGTVTVSGAGTRWEIVELPGNTLPVLQVGSFSKGELTISNGAEVSAGITSLGTIGFLGAKGTINIGAAADKQATAAGKLTTRVVEFGSGDGTLNFNHTDSAYEFSADLVSKNEVFTLDADAPNGNHEVHQIAGTTLLTGNSSRFTGTTFVDGGKLLVGNSAGVGILGGNVAVGAGGVLGGSGTIGSTDTNSVVTVASGGILAPGNSIGTLIINGDLNLQAGSLFAVEIGGAGTGDRVVVTGNAALAGTVQVTALNNGLSYQEGVTYRFLDAESTTGSFDNIVSDSAFLNLGLTEDGVGALVKVGITNTGDPLFATAAKTENQLAASTGLDTLAQNGASLALYNNILILNAENARNAFDQLSGEVHASAKSALVENALLTQNAINNRLRSTFGDVTKDKTQTEYLAGTGAWTQGFGRWSSKDGNGNVGDFKASTGGFVAGADSVIAENWRVGVLAGYSHTSFHANERFSSGNSENYTLGTYAGSQWAVSGGTLSFSTGLAYTWHQLETKRTVAFNTFADSLSADYKAATVQAFGELGYKVAAGNAAFEPYANLAYTHLKTNSFSETGTTAAALSMNSDTMDTAFTTLGLRASTAFTLGGISSTARADLGWRHAYGDVTPVSTARFVGSDVFTVAGTAVAKDVATFEAGFDFDLTQAAKLGVSYNGQFGSGARQNGFNVKLGVSF